MILAVRLQMSESYNRLRYVGICLLIDSAIISLILERLYFEDLVIIWSLFQRIPQGPTKT